VLQITYEQHYPQLWITQKDARNSLVTTTKNRNINQMLR
jgi:hypothetical protein